MPPSEASRPRPTEKTTRGRPTATTRSACHRWWCLIQGIHSSHTEKKKQTFVALLAQEDLNTGGSWQPCSRAFVFRCRQVKEKMCVMVARRTACFTRKKASCDLGQSAHGGSVWGVCQLQRVSELLRASTDVTGWVLLSSTRVAAHSVRSRRDA